MFLVSNDKIGFFNRNFHLTISNELKDIKWMPTKKN